MSEITKMWRCPRCFHELSEAEKDGARAKDKCTGCWLEKIRNYEEVKDDN